MSKQQGSPKQSSVGSQFSLYNGGELNKILTKDLVNNEVAIKQLINEYNLKSKEIQELREERIGLKTELDHQKTSPFYAIVSAICNIIGTIIVGYGVNLLSTEDSGIYLVILGGALILVSNIQTICHRWVRQWFSSPSSHRAKTYIQRDCINSSLT